MLLDSVKSVLEALRVPAVLIDANERIVMANKSAANLLDAELVGRHYVSALRQPELVAAISASLADGGARQTRYIVSHAEGDSVYVAQSAVLAGSTSPLVLVSFEDVSHLEQAGQQRRDFIANVSHELRTPLTALMGFIETLQGPAKDDKAAQERFLAIMSEEAARMERLVADLLSLSRVERQERQRPSEAVDMSALVRAAVTAFESTAARAGATLTLTAPMAPLYVTGDADQLRQVLSNLLENAVKYGGSAAKVDVSLTEDAHINALRGAGLRLSVSDTGQGIDPLHIPRLTERFYRVDNHRSRAVGGTGLGLAIVKHIVSRHRGRLRVTSEFGKGSTFEVLLPKKTTLS